MHMRAVEMAVFLEVEVRREAPGDVFVSEAHVDRSEEVGQE